MPTLPTALVVPTRDELVAQNKRNMQLRAPTAAVTNGALADIDAAVIADAVLPLYGESARQSDARTLDGKTGTDLQQEAIDMGQPGQLAAAGAVGFVVISGSSGNITAGAEIKNLLTGKRHMATATGLYVAGGLCPVVGIDTGPTSNVAAGTVLTWTSPPAGILGPAAVFQNSDGSGLTGGRDAEKDEEIRARIRAVRAAPAVSANDAAYQAAVIATPGLAAQAAFTYPAILGPGSTCVLFTLRPAKTGATRIPNNAQIGLVRGYVVGQMPKDDSATFGTIVAQPTAVALTISWATGVAQWTDGVPWPPYDSTGIYKISTVVNALSFSVSTASASPVAPQVGQNIALYDVVNAKFVQKRILTVGGANPYTLTIDTSGNASDTAFTPIVTDQVSPWSDSLNLLPAIVSGYFDTLGPGEQVNTGVTPFFDAGYRQKRSPADPQFWPESLTNKILLPVLVLPAISNATVVSPALPYSPTAGTLGVSSNMLTLSGLAAYPA